MQTKCFVACIRDISEVLHLGCLHSLLEEMTNALGEWGRKEIEHCDKCLSTISANVRRRSWRFLSGCNYGAGIREILARWVPTPQRKETSHFTRKQAWSVPVPPWSNIMAACAIRGTHAHYEKWVHNIWTHYGYIMNESHIWHINHTSIFGQCMITAVGGTPHPKYR